MANLLDKTQSKTIDWLRFSMAALVVLLHTGACGVRSEFPIYRALCILTSKGICQIAVPCFFLISGFLFFRDLHEWDWGAWKEKIKGRFYSLLVPYLLWNIIAFVCYFLYYNLRSRFGSMNEPFMGAELQDIGSLLRHVFWGSGQGNTPVNYPLWFIRDLILYSLITPFIYIVCKYLDIYGVVTLALFVFVFSAIPKGTWFYLLGCWLGIKEKGLFCSIYRYKWIMLILSVLLLTCIVWFYERDTEFYFRLLFLFTITGSICVISYVHCGIQSGSLHTCVFLTRSAFFIFASHGILILDDFAHYFMFHITRSRGELYYCCDLLFRPLIAIGICLGLFSLMNILLPRTTRVLMGAR